MVASQGSCVHTLQELPNWLYSLARCLLQCGLGPVATDASFQHGASKWSLRKGSVRQVLHFL